MLEIVHRIDDRVQKLEVQPRFSCRQIPLLDGFNFVEGELTAPGHEERQGQEHRMFGRRIGRCQGVHVGRDARPVRLAISHSFASG